jgi:hypothetical protein
MASVAERFHIVLSPDERRAWNTGAERLGVPTAEYVRRAVASFEAGLTPAELDQLSLLAEEVGQASGRMSAMIDRAVAAVDVPLDETAMRRVVAERLKRDPVILDPARLDFAAA